MDQGADRSAYIRDAEVHNGWWRGDTDDLERVSELPYRSDFFMLLLSIHRWKEQGYDSAVLPFAGQRGIGKTTVIKQAIATLTGTSVTPAEIQDQTISELVGIADPTQVLYVPVGRSLFELEEPATAKQELRKVVRYFGSRVAPPGNQKFIFIDDFGELDIDGDPRDAVVDLVDDSTYLFLSNDLQSPVDVGKQLEGSNVHYEHAHYPISILPIKFVDYVRLACARSSNDAHTTLAKRIGAAQSYRVEYPHDNYHESPIGQARRALAANDQATFVSELEALYFDYLESGNDDSMTTSVRTFLSTLCQGYIRDGGLLYYPHARTLGGQTPTEWPIDETINELIRANLQLTIFKSIAPHYSIAKPRNLLRLAAMAARKSPPEYSYTNIADRFEVDRRTIDRYLQALESATILTESTQYNLTRHRQARFYLGDPRYLVLLSQRTDHAGFERFADYGDLLGGSGSEITRARHVGDPTFERALALTAGFDHALRLSYLLRSATYAGTSAPLQQVEYYSDNGHTIDYIIHDREHVYPFALEYQPSGDHATTALEQFDPTVGSHSYADAPTEYTAPYRFIITDDFRQQTGGNTLREDHEDFTLVRMPYWLFLLIC